MLTGILLQPSSLLFYPINFKFCYQTEQLLSFSWHCTEYFSKLRHLRGDIQQLGYCLFIYFCISNVILPPTSHEPILKKTHRSLFYSLLAILRYASSLYYYTPVIFSKSWLLLPEEEKGGRQRLSYLFSFFRFSCNCWYTSPWLHTWSRLNGTLKLPPS